PFDLAGKGLEEAFEAQVNVEDGTDSTEIYYRPDPRSVALGSLVNRFTFHGRPFDAETGLYYFRNRYFDPELGRFITADPLGYVDGPSMYQFARYNPFNNSDPEGLATGGQTATSVGGYLFGVVESGVGVVWYGSPLGMVAAELPYAVDYSKRVLSAHKEGGIGATWQEIDRIGREENARTKKRLLGLIPVVNTVNQARAVTATYEKAGYFEGGRQIGRTTFSLAADLTLFYGGYSWAKWKVTSIADDIGRVIDDAFSRSAKELGGISESHVAQINTASPAAIVPRESFQSPSIHLNRHGQLTNELYTVDAAGMAPHKLGSLRGGKSQFLSTVDAEKAVLDAAAYADEAGLWVRNKAKVFVENEPVGVLGDTGELTHWINVYRTKTGFVHGTPGGAP
ncbi:MAG: RHS repeat-associated core domain-containing protein, partial [bacterium]|nr:RHS repeat-associated core domain-containing protein [bacterium]